MNDERRRLCGECGARAEYVVEPVGRCDWAGWADVPACTDHLGLVVAEYIADDMPRVQVRYVDTPQLPEPTECVCEGCTNLVGDGDGWCLNCERDITASIAKSPHV